MEKRENDVKLISKLETIIDRDRVLAFSDSIFAFAATLLVLKIDLPAVVDSQLSTQLTPDLFLLWPQYFANIISFLIIAYYWINHHMIFSFVKKFDKVIVWMNIVFLIFLSFLPFPVDLYGSHSTVPSIIAFYSFSLALVGFFLLIIWLYAMNKKHLLIQELTPQQKDFYTAKFLIAPVIFAMAIPLAFIDPVIAQCSWLFVLLAIYLLNRFGGNEKKTLV